MKDKLFILPAPEISPIVGIAYLNFIFIFLMLLVFYSFLATPAGFEIRMPLLGANVTEGNMPSLIRISSENVLYFNDKVVTFNDLKRLLRKSDLAHRTVYVQVDNRATMGRVADIWQLCKGLGIAEVKVTSY